MGDGGINDQLAGGFCRYSVDDYWMIPHFEKMLYDNGGLLAVYADAYVATGDAFYGTVAADTADWVRREMQSPEGGYYSSLDADSEGHEGKFYVWNRDEVRSALTAEEYAAFAPRYGLDREPNFEGHWHLHVFRSVEDIASTLGSPPEEVEAALGSARQKLLRIRELRIRPGRDDKILASWNGLMIRGLAVAARALGRDDLAESAGRALEFVRRTLWREGRLLATYNDGRAHLNAYLDDYAFLADAVLELQQVRFRADELGFARELLEVILRHHADERAGGFFFTSDDHEQLIHRSKSFGDDATPAGNGVAAFALQRMGYLLGESRYLEAAERTIRAGWAVMERYPQGHTSLLMALEEMLHPPEIVVLRGDRATIESWRRELAKLYSPRRMVLAVPADAPDLPAAIAEKTPRGAAVAYVCRGNVCGEPIASFPELAEALRA
jgi:uncharacterized protein YyaL (SSP411 family)